MEKAAPEHSAPEAQGTLANKQPKGAVNALRAAEETRSEACLPDGQFCSQVYAGHRLILSESPCVGLA